MYDNWAGVAKAPAVLISTGATKLDVRDKDFVLTTRLELTPAYGAHFHAGLCEWFGFGVLALFVQVLWRAGPRTQGYEDIPLRECDVS